jgi:hypothetical protein
LGKDMDFSPLSGRRDDARRGGEKRCRNYTNGDCICRTAERVCEK